MINKEISEEIPVSMLQLMKDKASRIRNLIAEMPPHNLIGHIYSHYFLKFMKCRSSGSNKADPGELNEINEEKQFLLEYVHAVLASHAIPKRMSFDKAKFVELLDLARQLRLISIGFSVISSSDSKEEFFGDITSEIEFHAKANWVLVRGHRYQVLEEEFYRYVLAPHDSALKEVYGVGSVDIAEGFQAMVNASRSGFSKAAEVIRRGSEDFRDFSVTAGVGQSNVMEDWFLSNPDFQKDIKGALEDIFFGGICNLSRHTKLPPTLLKDLAYQRGEETEFFADGYFSGTPYGTLPARKKPLIQLGSDYYAIDPSFTRDSGYRALLHGLLNRKPEYKKDFENYQKVMSEAAFFDILSDQIPGAIIFQEVYYKDPLSKQWCENDTLILLDDVLFLVEAKAGAAASIASPALDFRRHAQSVQDLVVKAYMQCERFFNYLNSADEVPLYKRVDGNYERCGSVRSYDYRVMLPIGLTVESFSPFSAYCKELPKIKPLLGRYAFISMSIDDLFVLRRLLKTPGEFVHYMEVRQAVAAIPRAYLFDEIEHLGAYLRRNRFDYDILAQLKDDNFSRLAWVEMGADVDDFFNSDDWEVNPVPTQRIPKEIRKLLEALNKTRSQGWLSADSYIRNFGEETRDRLSNMLLERCQTISQHSFRYFILSGEGGGIFIWIQNQGHSVDWVRVNEKASAAAVACNASNVIGVVVEVGDGDTYQEAKTFSVHIPLERTEDNNHIYEDADRMVNRVLGLVSDNSEGNLISNFSGKKVGRNQLCPCGSGLKYKRCHGF